MIFKPFFLFILLIGLMINKINLFIINHVNQIKTSECGSFRQFL